MITNPHELFADRLIHAYRRSGTVFVHGALAASVLAGFLLTELPAVPVLLWLSCLIAVMGYHTYLGRRLVAEERRIIAGTSTRPLAILAGLTGLGWGVGAAFLPFVSPPLQLLIILTLMATGLTSLPRMAALPICHAAYMGGLFVPILIALVVVFGLQHWMMVALLLVIWGLLADEARRNHADLNEFYSSCQLLQSEAIRDKLTGIPNRRSFDATLEREWRRAQRLRTPLSLIMIDVDFFKKYNDRYGHQAGDECLTAVAKALADGPQRAGDLVARYGGEEFVVLLFHTPRDDALAIAESLRKAITALGIPHEDTPTGVTSISLGGATCIPTADRTPESLLKAADTALYQAKAGGRNRVAWTAGELLSDS